MSEWSQSCKEMAHSTFTEEAANEDCSDHGRSPKENLYNLFFPLGLYS